MKSGHTYIRATIMFPSVGIAGILLLLMLIGCGNNGGKIESSGILESVEVNVSSKVSGQVLRLRVQEGSTVVRGDTLAVIDSEVQQLQLLQAQAGIDLAEAQYQLLKNGARSEDLQSAEETVRQTESGYKTAKADFDRIKELYSTHSVSTKQYEDSESRVTITQAQYNSAKQNLQKLQRFARSEDLNAAKARVAQARAQANLIRKQINDSHILAPVSGTVTYKPVEEGELIGTGTIIVRISRLERMELMIYVNEAELGKVKLGAIADVMIDTYPEKKYSATVVYVSPVAEFTPRNVQTKDERTKLVFGIKLEVENAEGDLKSGMPADAILQ
ncbi:MAG: efflux RND transporter periplasmic adaptor subunit [Bacteriovoracaceae bacterium]|nr:efflux RND transporter periplasmic adaptor subunit [Bacteroidota bacterium]